MKTIRSEKGYAFDFALEGDETVYSLPLMSALPLAQLREMAAANAEPDGDKKALAIIDAELHILRGVMGEKADTLTAEQVRLIFDAWSDAGEEAEAVGLGE